MSIDPDELRRLGASPSALASRLGPSLSAWLLTPKARAELGLDPPRLVARRGAAPVLLVWRLDALPELLAPGFVLPLEWQEGAKDDARLPAGLVDVASEVRSELESHRHGLLLAREAGSCDLSGLRVDAASCFAPLAAAQRLVSEGGEPDAAVLGTGVWRGNGIEAVEGLEAKVAAVASLAEGTGVPHTLFVPAADLPRARDSVPSGAKVEVFPYQAGQGLKPSLEPHLDRLDVAPARDADLHRRTAWLNRTWRRDRKRKREVYLERVVDDVAAKVRQQAADQGVSDVRRFALAVSLSPDLAVLLLKALEPDLAWLLVTDESAKQLASTDVQESLAGLRTRWTRRHVGSDAEALARDVRDWLAGSGEDGLRVVDITSAQRDVSAAALLASQGVGATVVYLKTGWDGRPIHGTEDLQVLGWVHGLDEEEEPAPRPRSFDAEDEELRPALLRWARYLLGGWPAATFLDAEDVVCAGLEAVQRTRAKEPVPSPYSLARTAATNWVRDEVRRRKKTIVEMPPDDVLEDRKGRTGDAVPAARALEARFAELARALDGARWERSLREAVDFYTVVLLDLRVAVMHQVLKAHGYEATMATARAFAERVVPWRPEDEQRTPRQGWVARLSDVWRVASVEVADKAGAYSDKWLCAAVSRMPGTGRLTRCAWHQWRRRAKDRLRARVGEETWKRCFAGLLSSQDGDDGDDDGSGGSKGGAA